MKRTTQMTTQDTSVNKVDQVDNNTEQELKALYGAIRDVIDQTIVTGEDEKVTMTFFIMASWFPESFDYYPYLHITSPTAGSGKSTCLEVIGAMVINPLIASNASSASIFRALAKDWITLLLDEVETFNLTQGSDLVGIINSGHKKSTATVLRCGIEREGFDPKGFFVGGFKVISGLPSDISKSLLTRFIEIIMQVKPKDQEVMRLSKIDSQIFDDIATRFKTLRDSGQVAKKLRLLEAPKVFGNRKNDKWEALFLIGELTGSPEKEVLIEAAKRIDDEQEEPDLGIQILSDIKQIMDDLKAPRIPSDALYQQMQKLRDGEWKKYDYGRGLSKNELQKRIRTFGVKTERFKHGGKSVTGYTSSQFHDSWRRYLPEEDTPE